MDQKKEQQVLPEEKLLKVIQGGGRAGRKPSGAGGEAATMASPVGAGQQRTPAPAGPAKAPRPAGDVMEKPSLKLAKAGEKGVGKPAEAGARLSTALRKPMPAKIGGPIPALKTAKHAGMRITLPVINRVLGAAAGAMFVLTGLEIMGAFQAFTPAVPASSAPPPAGGLVIPPSAGTNGLAAEDSDFTIFPTPPDLGGSTRTNEGIRVEWQAYAKENIAMIGRSGDTNSIDREAILFDKKVRKMHVLKIGQKLTVADREVTLEKIGGEDAVLTDGRRTLTLK